MAVQSPPSENDVTVLEWVVPRFTGRWHQSIVVTAHHVWVMPELTFANNEAMTAAAAGGLQELYTYLKGAGWTAKPPRLKLDDVRGVNWNETTGWMRILGQGDKVIGAMISDRETGNALEPKLKQAIAVRVLGSKKKT